MWNRKDAWLCSTGRIYPSRQPRRACSHEGSAHHALQKRRLTTSMGRWEGFYRQGTPLSGGAQLQIYARSASAGSRCAPSHSAPAFHIVSGITHISSLVGRTHKNTLDGESDSVHSFAWKNLSNVTSCTGAKQGSLSSSCCRMRRTCASGMQSISSHKHSSRMCSLNLPRSWNDAPQYGQAAMLFPQECRFPTYHKCTIQHHRLVQ